jgi:hypothetical protein
MSYRSQPSYCSTLSLQFSQFRPQAVEDGSRRRYVYAPLRRADSSIRLVYLLPRRSWPTIGENSMVRVEMMAFPVDRAPPYVALSYAWGDATRQRPLRIGNTELEITESLDVALRHIAEDNKTLVLWVDALCINQSHDVEKSFQVQRMGSIYQSAAMTLAWLGPAADESDLAFQELRDFFRQQTPARFREASQAEVKGFLSARVANLFARPWFTRVWVKQEVMLNKVAYFVCGGQDITKQRLVHAFICYVTAISRFRHDFVPFHVLRFALRFSDSGPWPLADYMADGATSMGFRYGRFLQSSEPRDFVYSHLGMIKDHHQLIKIDYSDTVEDIYSDFAEVIVRESRTVRDISRIWGPSKKYRRLPSWVPDWSAPGNCLVVSDYLSAQSRSNLGSFEPRVERSSTGRRLLYIQAAKVGVIEDVFHGFDAGNTDTDTGDIGAADMSRATTATEETHLGFGTHEAVKCYIDTLANMITISRSSQTGTGLSIDGESIDKEVFSLSIGMDMSRVFLKHGANRDELFEAYRKLRQNGNQPDPSTLPFLKVLGRLSPCQIFSAAGGGVVGLSRDDVAPGDLLVLIPLPKKQACLWAVREVADVGGCCRLISNVQLTDKSHYLKNLEFKEVGLC